MKVFIGIAAFFILVGLGNKETTFVVLGIFMILGLVGWKLTKWGARTTSNAVSTALSDRREEKTFQTNLRRRVQEERELAAVRNESMLTLYRGQVELIAQHKREGANVEREIYEMRTKLLEHEKQENSAMIQELIGTLDRL
jgi:flagellar biosynthesis component FlhA